MSYEIEEFRCAMCGNCCRGEGYVRLRPEDVTAMAAHLGLSEEEFCAEYTRPAGIAAHAAAGDIWLKDKPGPEQECIMLENNLCRVHPVKPPACVGFPLKWRTPDVMDYCEGLKR